MAVPHHVYPMSLDLDDLAHAEEPGIYVKDRPEPACALCQRGLCTQRVEDVNGIDLVVHGMMLQ